MKTVKSAYLLLLVALITIFIWLVWGKAILSSRTILSNLEDMGTQEQSKKTNNPCWFMNVKEFDFVDSEVKKKRWDRETYGYPENTPLKEAIRIFNEEENCFPYSATLPPLTEEELIAAIISGADYGREGDLWLAQKDALFKIALKKVMPKGTLFVSNSSVRLPDSPLGKAVGKGRRIYLFLDLDKNPREANALKPEQIFLIRKNFFNVENGEAQK